MIGALQDIVPGARVRRPTTLRNLMSDDQVIARVRLTAGLLVSFALSGLILALLGIYGVVGESVRRRTRELGIRMALGAPLANVVLTVVKDALKVTIAGLAVGIVGTLVLSEATATALYGRQFANSGMRTGLLFGVDASDPRVLLATCLLVMAVAALAGWTPVRRATRIDPAETLRQE